MIDKKRDKKKLVEYGIYTASIIAILAVMMVPTTTITGQVVDRTLEAATSADTDVIIKNTDAFTWNNVRVVLDDANGFSYTCPSMLYLRAGSTATIDINYCFSRTNVKMSSKPVKVTITADEGSSSFVY